MTAVPFPADPSAAAPHRGGRTRQTSTGLAHIAPEGARLFDVQAVAAILGCSTRHVYRLSDAGRMPAPVKLGALVRWRKSTGDPATGIEDWVVAGCPSCRKGTGR